ncbi:MAG: metallophosphoesterase [Synergistaceae bacterium]|nr:metallophosphoesterase [Synergistaceae bacterium]
MLLSLILWFISIWLEYFVYRKLQQAGISPVIRNLFVCWALFWFIAFIFRNHIIFFLRLPEPFRLSEISGGLCITWIIITILAFMGFMIVNILTGFKPFTKRKVLFSVMLTCAGVVWCLLEAYFVQTREITIKTHKLPEGRDRIRITYITDLHLGGIYTSLHFDRVMRLIEESSPDIFIMCGDIFDGNMSYWTQEISRLSRAAKSAPLGAFAVNGNHENDYMLTRYYDDFINILRESGFKLLSDERADTGGLVIIGVEDRKNKFHSWIKFLLTPEDADKFVLVIKHRPYLPQDAQGNFDLQLSGHTHGGQFWPVGYYRSWLEGWIPQGLSKNSGGYIYVSNGAGYNGPCMRLFAPPEVTVIDLVRE